MKNYKACLLLLVSFNVMAGSTNKTMICPSLTSEGQSIKTSITNLKNLIKPFPECTQMTQKLVDAGEILTSPSWEKITASLRDESEFDGKDLEVIAALTETASAALNDVIGQFSSNRRCVDNKDSAKFMAQLSGMVKGVSTVVGTVSGPYGMAVTLGGELVAQAITSIDKLYKSRHPYNFNNEYEKELFANQFCAYSEIQKDINDFLSIDERKAELESLESYLVIKQKDLEENCPECLGQGIASKAHERSLKILTRIEQTANIYPRGPDENFTRCNEIHRAFHSTDSDFFQFIALLSTYVNPMSSSSDRSLREEYVKHAHELKKFPKLSDCWNLDPDQKRMTSREFNELMRDDILPLGHTIFRQEMIGLKMRANKKYVQPLGDFTERTLLRKAWIKEQKAEVERKKDHPHYFNNAEPIIIEWQALGVRMDRLLEDYLKHLRKANLKEIDTYTRKYDDFASKNLKEYGSIVTPAATTVSELIKAFERKPNVDRGSFDSDLKDHATRLNLVIAQTSNIDHYCHFLDFMLLTTSRAYATCKVAKDELKAEYAKLRAIDDLTKNQIDRKFKWLVSSGNYQRSRVRDFSIHLQEWIAQGEKRWELRDPRDIPE